MTFLFELYRTDRYENQSVKWLIFSFAKIYCLAEPPSFVSMTKLIGGLGLVAKPKSYAMKQILKKEKDYFVGYAEEMKGFLKDYSTEDEILKQQIEDFIKCG